jgi:thiamine-phosphate pyrophosphorylase
LIPSVYPITDTSISGLTHLEQVTRLIDGGATLIQLRGKRASPREFYEQAVECVAFARARRAKIIINDRADIALMSDADGVHLGQDDMPPEAVRRLLGDGKIVGYSTHSVEQAIEAAKLCVDYIAIGPVFQTHTKTDPDPVVGLEGIAAVRAAIGVVPLVAIGGIDLSNIAAVLNAGADSVAMIGAILTHPLGIEQAMREALIAASV